MLVRDGRLSEEQLRAAIEQQAAEGGRLGSLLVQAGLVDAETLTVYLGLELGIPIATGATLERCKRAAVKLLDPEQAARFRCIPIVIQGQTLIVAVDDPHDMVALDQLSQITGYRIVPRVAPEIRIYYYLERFYGVRRPQRFHQLGESLRGSRELTEEQKGLPAPPLPGLPPKVAAPQPAPTPTPVVRPAVEPPPVPPVEDDEHEALELDAADLVEELEADEAEVADTAPAAEVSAVSGGGRARTSQTMPAVYEPLDRAAALERIRGAEQHSAIAEAVLGYCSELFELTVLLLVRDGMAFGWKGFGPHLDPDRIETLLVPLDVPSMFQVAVHSDGLYRGKVFPTTLHNHWFKVVRSPVPTYSIVAEIKIGRRPVNLIYGHTAGGADLSDDQLADLRAITRAAADTYVRLISASKQRAAPDDGEGGGEQAGAGEGSAG